MGRNDDDGVFAGYDVPGGSMKTVPTIIRLDAMNLRWDYCRDPASGLYVSKCDEIGLTASGETFEDLVAEMHQAMHLLFIDLVQEKDLGAFLERRGWSQVVIPHVPIRSLRFDVPFALVRAPAPSMMGIASACP